MKGSRVRFLTLAGVLASSACVEDWCDRFSLECAPEPAPARDVVDEDGDVWTADIDCDDTDPMINPGSQEICDGLDNDCDGTIDEGTPGLRTWYEDADRDGYGNPAVSRISCEQPPGFVLDDGDCDDLDYQVNPEAQEICNLRDDDCDGLTDDDDDTLVEGAGWDFYEDADEDGYGNSDVPAGRHCSPPDDWPCATVPNDQDCDDSTADAHPGGTEVWYDGVDGDCDGWNDFDQDRDGFDAEVAGGDDCDDAAVGTYPGATETCAGVDRNCDGRSCSAASVVVACDTWSGDTAGGNAGRALAAGDIDGDGGFEIVVGAPSADAGVVWVVEPATSAGHLGVVAWGLAGAKVGDAFGTAVVTGDVDGDGVADLVVGASANGDGAALAGTVYVFAGPVSGEAAAVTVSGLSAEDALGNRLALAGDLDGDGVDDLLATAPGRSHAAESDGVAYVLRGPLSASVDLALAPQIHGDDAGAELGQTTAAGDLDGDGFTDLVLGNPRRSVDHDEDGLIHVVLGPTSGTSSAADAHAAVSGGEDQAWLGSALSIGGDLDGDGLEDLLVGSAGTRPSSGGSSYAYVLLDLPSGSQVVADAAAAALVAETSGDGVGASLAGGVDLDGDGLLEVAIGAPSAGWPSVGGSVYVYGGPWTGSVSLGTSEVRVDGQALAGEAGAVLEAAGDIDGDGVEDLLVGAPSDGMAALDGGAVHLLPGGSW